MRLAEFDELLAIAVQAVEPIDARRLRLRLRLDPEPAVAARVADLVARGTGCCSYFTFTLTATSGTLTLDVAVPPEHVAVLDVLTRRAAAGADP